jgi:hypothetical protein
MEGLPMTPSVPQDQGCAIKVLDLLTNRYHLGMVRAALADMLIVDVAASRFCAGQRIRFVLADDAAGIVERRAMRLARVLSAQPDSAGVGQRISLELAVESIAA